MNSASAVNIIVTGQTPHMPSTGLWDEGRERRSEASLGWVNKARLAGLAFSLTTSPLTAISDPWFLERRRRDAVVTVSVYEEVLGRYISRSDALRIACQILAQAERERIDTADWEASRGIQWGD